MKRHVFRFGIFVIFLLAPGLLLFSPDVSAQNKGDCTAINNTPGQAPLETVAEFSDRLVTGVTVSEDNRVFVNFPYWYPQWYKGAVAEILPDGTVKAYPDEKTNAWRIEDRLDPQTHFVCVQSVVADKKGSLWVLDPGAPWPTGLIENAPKLVRIDLKSDKIARTYSFSREIAPEGSYLNDVRIDLKNGYAYMTDSGKGAIVALELESGNASRVLEDHPSTTAEDVSPVIGGKKLAGPDGNVPKIHSDGIAYDPGKDDLYYHSLTGYHTFRIPAKFLRDETPNETASEDLGTDVVTDGMHLDAKGRLYYTALEYDGILRRNTDGTVVPLIIDKRLRWPDTLAIDGNGNLYVTISQIHNTPRFSGDKGVPVPWAVYRIRADIRPPE